MKKAFEINDVWKTYKSRFTNQEKTALQGVSLDIEEGSFFGLLGSNGAGKSTLINIIAGLVVKSSGSVKVNGFDLDKDIQGLKRSIGIVPQEVVVDPFFTVRKCLEYYAGYFGVKKADRRTDEILDALSLTDKAETYPRRLSGGMKRRLLIAKALVHNPKILILDEPTAGVDVELREGLWNYVKELNNKGTTILLTTHYLEEAQELCDKIAVINHGKIIANDSKDNLINQFGDKSVSIDFESEINNLPKSLGVKHYEISDDKKSLRFSVCKDDESLNNIFEFISQKGLKINNLSSAEPKLEHIFRKLINS